MPLLLPFRRAPVEEKVLLGVLYPLAMALAAFAAFPLLLLYLMSFGDATDWWAGASLPVSLRRYAGPTPFYVRYLHQRYDSWTGGFLSHYYPQHWEAGKTVSSTLGRIDPPPGNWRRQAEDARECLKTMPWTHKWVLHLSWSWNAGSDTVLGFSGRAAADWRRWLLVRHHTLANLNAALETEYKTMAHVNLPDVPGLAREREYMLTTPIARAYRAYLTDGVDPGLLTVWSGALEYETWLKSLPETGGDLARFNTLVGASWAAWDDVPLPTEAPAEPVAGHLWEQFVHKVASPYLLEIADPAAQSGAWQRFLTARYGSLEAAGAKYGVAQLPLVPAATLHGFEEQAAQYADWSAFARGLPVAALRMNGPEQVWARWLKAKYGSASAVAEAHGTALADLSAVPWPQPALDRMEWEEHRVALVLEGIFHNFRRAWIMMAQATPAVWNTVLYTFLFVVLALATNTGLAWSLSRFKWPPLQMTLVYFLALAAFPLEAVAIPNFLLLRQLGLLNTIWALVLPTIVNGYYVYLLKSGFDTIPRPYFEEAQLSGAGEWRMFAFVALPMAAPMIGVVALYAFLLAYSNFLWALIVGQSRDLWTLPVLVYSVNNIYPPPSLVSAMLAMLTVPPLVVFLAANRTLQRSLTITRW